MKIYAADGKPLKGRRFRCSRAVPSHLGVPLYGVEVMTPDGRWAPVSSKTGRRLVAGLREGGSLTARLSGSGRVFTLEDGAFPEKEVAEALLQRFERAVADRLRHLGERSEAVRHGNQALLRLWAAHARGPAVKAASRAPAPGVPALAMSKTTVSKTMILNAAARYPADPEDVEKARQRIMEMERFVLPNYSTFAALFMAMSERVYMQAPGFDTWATALDASGLPILIINPVFTNQVDTIEGLAFVAAHEVYHPLLRHFSEVARNEGLSESSMQNLIVAQEAMINHLLLQMGFQMPTVGGKKVGIDPVSLYTQVRKRAQEAGVWCPDTKAGFYSTTETVFHVLESLPKPPPVASKACATARGQADADSGKGGSPAGPDGGGQKSGGGKGRSDGDDQEPDGDDGPGFGPGDLPHDQDSERSVITAIAETAVQEAINGSQVSRKEAEELLGATSSDWGSQMWGSVGGDALRGSANLKKKASRDWYKWVASFVGSRLGERGRLAYNRKIPWDPRVSPVSRVRKKTGVVGIDVSGSMSQDVIDSFLRRLGSDFPDLELIPVAWDAEAAPIADGEQVRGGGGTVFEPFDQWVADNVDDPDFILVVTDGYFSKPALLHDPEIYGFLVVPGGDPWMETGWTAAGRDWPPAVTFALTEEDLES